MSEGEEQPQESPEKELDIKLTGCHPRLKRRLHRLKEHHEKCLAECMEYIHSQTQESSSDSADTCILETSCSTTSDDPDVPPLTRADSVLVTKEYLKWISRASHGSGASISCVESSSDEYFPAHDSADEGSSEEPTPHLRGSDTIRQMAKECGAKHPETLSSTKLRKQVSTLSTVLNLKGNEMDIFVDFPCHDIRVHRLYYRLPEGTMELDEVQIALEQGWQLDFTGKSLDELKIDPCEVILEAVDSDLSETEGETSFCSSGSSSSKKRCQPESDSDSHLTEGPENYEPGSIERGTKGSTRCSGSKKRRRSESHSDDDQAGSSRYTDLGSVETADDNWKKETPKRRSWTQREVHAVEKTLKSFIDGGKVPVKSDCVACIKASPDALKDRSWTAVKFYVNNRITAIQRESARKLSFK